MTPLRLAPNAIDHFYRGGERIAALRRAGVLGDSAAGPMTRPEEWLGSTVTRWGSDRVGLADLGDAGLLRDLVAADPEGWLGADAVDRWGPSPAVLVKLLDAGERLPVHVHPTRAFAARHLSCPFGKSEAWVVVDVPSDGGTVYVGTTRPVSTGEWAELVDAQATSAMLDLLHPVRVHPGDGVFVPSGTPHAIGAGLFVVELQEPTDLSILLEWTGFDIDGRRDGHLGLGYDVALDAVRRDAVDTATLDQLVHRGATGANGAEPTERSAAVSALPAAADPYFRAWAVSNSDGAVTVPASFSVVVVLAGSGTMRTSGGAQPLTSGDAFVVPHGAGAMTFDGALSALVAQPAVPSAPEPVEWDAP